MRVCVLLIASTFARNPGQNYAVDCAWTVGPALKRVTPAKDSVYLEWTAADTNAYEVTGYELCVEEPSDVSLRRLGHSNWTNRRFATSGRGRSFLLKSLTPASVYRISIRAYAAPCIVSALSEWRVVATTGIVRYELEAEGTGSNNHLPARIRLSDQVLLRRDDFRGLYLHALSRFDLSTIFAGKFDTHTSEQAANNLADRLLTFDSSVVVVLVSCDVWEGNVTQALVYALQLFGAKLISEVRSSGHIRQPYAFIGVRSLGLIAGQSIESLRANKGLYLYDPRDKVKVPTARARLELRKNAYRQFFYIEANSHWQYDRETDYYEGSLRFLIYDVREANTTLLNYLGFVYRADYGDMYSSEAVKLTELDRIWVGGPVSRYDFKHTLYSPGDDVDLLPQTPIIRAILQGKTCPPPYTDAANPACTHLPNPPLMLKCGVGITPYNCAYLGETQIETTSQGV